MLQDRPSIPAHNRFSLPAFVICNCTSNVYTSRVSAVLSRGKATPVPVTYHPEAGALHKNTSEHCDHCACLSTLRQMRGLELLQSTKRGLEMAITKNGSGKVCHNAG